MTTLWQRLALRRLRREAGRGDAEPLSPEDLLELGPPLAPAPEERPPSERLADLRADER